MTEESLDTATMIDDCMENDSCLSQWERDLVQRLSELVDDGKAPSAKQLRALTGIWERVTW